MSKYISEEESAKYKAEMSKYHRVQAYTFSAVLLTSPLAIFLASPYQSVACLVLFVLVILAGFNRLKFQYFRSCPRCNGRLYWLTNVCTKCDANVHRVSKKSDGSEWLS